MVESAAANRENDPAATTNQSSTLWHGAHDRLSEVFKARSSLI